VSAVQRSQPVIGLCGGIGAGKSAVAAAFGRQGCTVISSDRLNHEVLAEAEVLRQLAAWWGADIVRPDGTPDRRRIAAIVFEDAEQKRRLERLVYPLIGRRRAAIIRSVAENPAVKAIVLDSPLLLESNLDRECDSIVFVDTGEPERLRRLKLERGWTPNELHRRERWQAPLSEKRSRADFVVDNDGPSEGLDAQVADILRTIVSRHAKP
jgi:dephospho-CoA kinase